MICSDSKEVVCIEVEQILHRLYYKQEYAQMTDYEYDSNNYVWVLGADIYRELINYLERNVTNYVRDTAEVRSAIILGIRVEKVDYRHPSRIGLYKEV